MKTFDTFTHTLPAYWASYLINGDASGISDEDKAQADAFLNKRNLSHPVSCSDESWFAHRNDAGTLAGDVMDFTFLVPREATPEGDNSAPCPECSATGQHYMTCSQRED